MSSLFGHQDRALLYDVFESDPSEAARFGLTEYGIWHATPLEVLLPALEAVARAGWLEIAGRPATLLDAGSGDGRVAGALSLASGLSPRTRVLGLESDTELASRALERLERLDATRPAQIARGDFLDPASYDDFGIRPCDVDVFLNYPDGNEAALGRFIVREAPGAAFIALSPDRGFALAELELLDSLEVVPDGPGWSAHRFAAP